MLLDGVARGDQEFELAAAVARGGLAGGQEGGAELDAGEVRVHLPQAGQQCLTTGVHHRHALGDGDL